MSIQIENLGVLIWRLSSKSGKIKRNHIFITEFQLSALFFWQLPLRSKNIQAVLNEVRSSKRWEFHTVGELIKLRCFFLKKKETKILNNAIKRLCDQFFTAISDLSYIFHILYMMCKQKSQKNTWKNWKK